MRPRPAPRPMFALTCAASLVALALLLPTGESRAFRDGGCMWPPTIPRMPVVLGGVRMPGDDPDAAQAVAGRLGIGTRSCREGNGWWMEGAQLGPTALMWEDFGSTEGALGIPTPGVVPLLRPMTDWGCPWYAPMTPDQPSGAMQIVRVSALVNDLESTGQVWGWGEPLVFGAPFDVPWLGARAREARVENGMLRMITPVDPDQAGGTLVEFVEGAPF